MTLITEDELKIWTGYEHRGKVEQFLRTNKIKYFHGKEGRLCTTDQFINNSTLNFTVVKPEVSF
jgi:hypothetical protein